MTDEEEASSEETPKQPKTSEEAARRAWKDPLHPGLDPRCPRCGERAEKEKPKLEDPTPDPDAPPPPCAWCGVDPLSMEAGAEVVFKGGWFKEVLIGLLYAPRSFLWLIRSPSMWKPARSLMLTNLVLTLLAFVMAFLIVVPWLKDKPFSNSANENALWTPFEWAASPPDFLVEKAPEILLFMALAWLLLAFPFGLLARLALTPHIEKLSEAAERSVLGMDELDVDDFERARGTTVLYVKDTLLLAGIQMVIYVLFVWLGIFWVLWLIWFLLGPFMVAGFENTNITLIRHSYGLGERVRLYRTYRRRYLAFGVAYTLMTTVPLINLLMFPAGVLGGVLLYLELERK